MHSYNKCNPALNELGGKKTKPNRKNNGKEVKKMEKNNMKIKIISTMGILITLIILLISPTILADTTDTFTVTVTGEYIECNIIQATWSVNGGTPVLMSTSYDTTSGDTFTADTSNSSVAIDLKLQITGAAATWTAATSGNGPGADTYRLNASTDTFNVHDVQILLASQTTISSSIAAGQDETFDLRFDSPTSTTTGVQQTITLTASAIKA
jgi:hypothetical protein